MPIKCMNTLRGKKWTTDASLSGCGHMLSINSKTSDVIFPMLILSNSVPLLLETDFQLCMQDLSRLASCALCLSVLVCVVYMHMRRHIKLALSPSSFTGPSVHRPVTDAHWLMRCAVSANDRAARFYGHDGLFCPCQHVCMRVWKKREGRTVKDRGTSGFNDGVAKQNFLWNHTCGCGFQAAKLDKDAA